MTTIPKPSLDRWLLQRVLEKIGPAPIGFDFRGENVSSPDVAPLATVRIAGWRTLAKLVLDPEIGFGEGYANGRIQVEGDLPAALTAVYRTMAERPGPAWYSRLRAKWMEWSQSNTLRGSRSNIHRHYDLGNDFYKLWLDSELVYTCAYFPTPSATLEQAQTAKMDHICRKLRLRPGETVAEAGCGWGAMALHMARTYGVSVKAFNISREQIHYARQRAAEEDLTGRVEFIEDDYRNLSGKFDVFLSVGMLEHVGLDHYADMGRVIHRSIGNRGRGLLHFIGRNQKGDFSRWIRKRIFPGAYAPTLREALSALEPWNYAVLDVENLRLHYARTLEHWLERFDSSGDDVATMYDAWFRRAWRLYLAGSIAGFRSGTLQLFQMLFAGSECRPMCWTRAPLYRESPLAEKTPQAHREPEKKQPEEKPSWIHATS
jgi:cyclopropane-fatty-acyl-phospholipid synthase